MKLTLEERLAHGGHPVLLSTMTGAFCLSNLCIFSLYLHIILREFSLNSLHFPLFLVIL